MEIEGKAERRRIEVEALKSREMALRAELDAARAAEAEGRTKIDAVTIEAKAAAKVAEEAQGRATELVPLV